MPTAFEAATAAEALGAGAYRARSLAEWETPRGANGGFLAAIVLRAMAAELDDPARPARSVTIHYLRPPHLGDLRIEVEVVRSGRTLSTLTARGLQGDRLCVLAMAAFAQPFAAAESFTAPMPQVPPAAAIEPIPSHPGLPPIAHRVEMRPAVGAPLFSGADEALTGGWLRLEHPQRLDAPTLALLADVWVPAVFPRLRGPAFVPTIDLTIHFRDPAAALAQPPEDPVLGIFRSDYAADGLIEEDGELWSAGGVLLAHSRQLALLQLPGGAVIGYLGLGSNLGDRRAHLQAAVAALPAQRVRVLASSSTYDTDPVGLVLDQPAFLNACVRVETELGPVELLDACKAVEAQLGRDLVGGRRHGPRPIDVDVLLLGNLVHESERLTLPHEQATSRRFVLIPLLELDIELTTPDGTRLADCLARLPVAGEGVRRAGDPLATAG